MLDFPTLFSQNPDENRIVSKNNTCAELTKGRPTRDILIDFLNEFSKNEENS
jgi:hypothetical protein